MTAQLRHVAPAAAPIRLVDLVRWISLTISGGDVAEDLTRAIRARFGVRHCVLTSTGRAGLTLLLKALRRLAPTGRDEVILPSYTCFSVAASVVKAGLRPRIVDISPDTLDYDPDQLNSADFTRVLAIVTTNLYGLPNDLPAISEIARQNGVFLIDDAAQSMGASVGGRWSGTWGDAGLFSFDKGKNVSAIDGGVVVTNSNEIASALAEEMAGLSSPGLAQSGFGVLKALAYFLLLRPWLYWIPNGIPQLELGKTVFAMNFLLERPSRPLVALALAMLNRLDEFTNARTTNAARLLEGLSGIPGIRTITPLHSATPVYSRLPILIPDSNVRCRALQTLRGIGIGATGSYPTSLADVNELRSFASVTSNAAGGRYIAGHILTLPTHMFVTAADVNRTIAAIADGTVDVTLDVITSST